MMERDVKSHSLEQEESMGIRITVEEGVAERTKSGIAVWYVSISLVLQLYLLTADLVHDAQFLSTHRMLSMWCSEIR